MCRSPLERFRVHQCKPCGSSPSGPWRWSPEWCRHRQLIPTWPDQQRRRLQASAVYVLALVMVPERCKQIGPAWTRAPASITGPPPWQWYSPVFLLVWQPLPSTPPPWARAHIGANANAALAISIGQRIELLLVDRDFMPTVWHGLFG